MKLNLIRSRSSKSSVEQTLKALSHERDLTLTSDHTTLGPWLNRFLNSVHDTLTRGLSGAIAISSQAPVLSRSARLAEEDSAALSDTAAQVASASEEISTTVNGDLSEATESMHQLTADATRAVHQGDSRSNAVLQQITATRDEVHDLQSSIQEVDQQADEMQRIIGLIGDISNQTNLLALNAAIEAARAGEAGRGFSVVADEVRALAHRTMEATQEVESRISRIRDRSEALTRGGASVSERVEQSWEGINDIRATLADAAGMMSQLEGRSQQVAAGTHQIGTAIAAVSQDIQGVTDVSQRLKFTATELNKGSASIREQGDLLLEALGVFQLALHQTARQDIEALAQHPELAEPGNQAAVVQRLRSELSRQGERYELLYLVGLDGRQISPNVHSDTLTITYSGTGEGMDWSERDWFREAKATQNTYVTQVYRSAATDEYCFTASAPVVSDTGQLVAILGADLRLSALLAQS